MKNLQKKEIMVLLNNAGYANQEINVQNIKLNFAFLTVFKNTRLFNEEALASFVSIFNKYVGVIVNNKGKFEITYSQIKDDEKEFVITTAKSILSLKNQKQNQKYQQCISILEK